MPRQQHLLNLTLPIPPSINEQYATVNGMCVSTVVARRFKQQVRQDYLALLLVFYFETPFKRDLDGGLKITQDALCESLGINDNRIVTIHLVKYIDPLHPHLDVELEALDDWQFDEEYALLPKTF